MKLLNKSFGLLVLISLSLVFCPIVVRSDDDNNEEDGTVNDEGVNDALKTDEGGDGTTASPFVKTKVLFVQPDSVNLQAGRLVKLLIGFRNNGTTNFLVDGVDGSFRYPQDFSYFIQNFTAFEYKKVVESEKEATFEYMFTPSETFASRQFGLTINLRYRSLDGKQYVNSVFNETVSIVEPEEGLDGETFLLYIFLAAILVVLAIVAQQFFNVFKKKGRGSKSSAQKPSNGSATSNGEIDLEWIPKEHLQTNKSPKVSPRQRRANGRTNGNTLSGNSSNDEH